MKDKVHDWLRLQLQQNKINSQRMKTQYSLLCFDVKLLVTLTKPNQIVRCDVFCTKWWLSCPASFLRHLVQMLPMSGTYDSQQHGDVWRVNQHRNNFKLYRNCCTVSCMQCWSSVDRAHNLWRWRLVKSVTLCCKYILTAEVTHQHQAWSRQYRCCVGRYSRMKI